MSLFRKAEKAASKPEKLAEDVLYAIGDIHGCFDQLVRLYDIIKKDIDDLQPRRSTEIFLGDYVDRGPDSREVVDWLIQSRPASDERVCLMGNHEAVLLDYLANPQMVDVWRNFGAAETFVSYGLPPHASTTRTSIEKAHRDFLAALPKEHKEFFETLPRYIEIGEYFFTHAGVNPNKNLNAQSDNDLLWIREPFLSSKRSLGRTVIHGHTPRAEPELRTNRINVDTGAYYSGTLSCVRLHRGSATFLNSDR